MKCLFKFHNLIILVVMMSVGVIHAQQEKVNNQKEKPVIYLQDFDNRGQGYDIFGEVMKYSIKGILDLTEDYRIVTRQSLEIYLEELGAIELKDKLNTKEDFLRYKADLLFTEVLRGSYMPILQGKQVLWEIEVFKMIDGQDVFSRAYQSTTDAEIFDVIDGIGQDMSGVLTGKVLATARVDVSTMVPGSVIYIDGIPAGKNSVQYTRAIAGLPHKVEIRNEQGDVLFEKTIVPVKGMIYDINYNYKEYEKLVEKEVFRPATNVIESTNVVALTNKVEVMTTNEMKVFSTNWVEEKVSHDRTISPGDQIVSKWGWGISGGGGTMIAMAGYYRYQGLKFELDLGFVPQFLGYTTDNYISARLTLSIYPFSQDAMISPYMKLGIMTYYGLSLGIIPTLLNDYEAFGVSFHFKSLPGILGRMKIFVEYGGMGSSIIESVNINNTIPHSIFDQSTLGFGVTF